MTNYTKATDFAAKDALLTGNPSKVVRGTEIGAELDAIEVADATSVKSNGAGSTDNALARFDSTTGKILQNSSVTADDSGNVTATSFIGPLTGNVTGNLTGNASTATSSTTATNLTGGGAGQIPYQAASGDTDMLAAGTAGQVLTSGGAAPPTWGNAGNPPPERQTVLSGPVDTGGFSSFGGSTGSTTVTASGTLVATAANGFNATGQVDYTGSITNPSWTGLSTNGVMYLYLDIAAAGTCTTGSTTLEPTYRNGGADVTTNNQFTFNIQEMVGKVGNGSVATQTYRVFVGEVTVSGGVVTVITWYQLMGQYQSALYAVPAISTRTALSHNIGCDPQYLDAKTFARFLTSWNGYTTGMVIPVISTFNGAYRTGQPAEIIESRVAASFNNQSDGVQAGTPATGATAYTIIPAGSGTAQLFTRVWRKFK